MLVEVVVEARFIVEVETLNTEHPRITKQPAGDVLTNPAGGSR